MNGYLTNFEPNKNDRCMSVVFQYYKDWCSQKVDKKVAKKYGVVKDFFKWDIA